MSVRYRFVRPGTQIQASPGGNSPFAYNEPSGGNWVDIYYNDGSDDDPVTSTGVGAYDGGGPGGYEWTSDRGDGSGLARVDARSDVDVISMGYEANANGSGYSLEFYHPADFPGGVNYRFPFWEMAGLDSLTAFGEVYVRIVYAWPGYIGHGEKQFYLGHMTGTNSFSYNDWYPTYETQGTTDFGFINMNNNMPTYVVGDPLVYKGSTGDRLDFTRGGLAGNESYTDVVIEYVMKMSENVGESTGRAQVWVNNQLMAFRDWNGDNSPYGTASQEEADDGLTVSGWRLEAGTLTNAWAAFLWEASIQNTTHSNSNQAHTRLVRELKIMGIPVTGNDGTSWVHGTGGI